MIAYKFLRPDGTGVFTRFAWPLPGDRPGAWVEAPIQACRSGIHACRVEHLPLWLGRELYEIELAGAIVAERTKVVAERGRLVRRVDAWDDRRDVPYRLVYAQQQTDGAPRDHEWKGVVRRDPVDRPVLNVADVSCNIHAAFPNPLLTANVARLDPDLIAFTGDQFYESTGGYGVQRAPLEPAVLDYLRKWYMHGWTWRELTRDRPSISIPDDHDVYQGNNWGEGGAPQTGTQGSTDGRNHWPVVMSMALAGGGLRHGQVIGATEKDGGQIKERPVTPGDLAATIYRHMGVPLDATYQDPSGRPRHIVEQGQPIKELV